jgi:hypothetical protein
VFQKPALAPTISILSSYWCPGLWPPSFPEHPSHLLVPISQKSTRSESLVQASIIFSYATGHKWKYSLYCILVRSNHFREEVVNQTFTISVKVKAELSLCFKHNTKKIYGGS